LDPSGRAAALFKHVDALLCVLQIFDYVDSSPLLRQNTYIMLTSDNGEIALTKQPPLLLTVHHALRDSRTGNVGCMPQQQLLRRQAFLLACFLALLLARMQAGVVVCGGGL
jgi:hypothetical protein